MDMAFAHITYFGPCGMIEATSARAAQIMGHQDVTPIIPSGAVIVANTGELLQRILGIIGIENPGNIPVVSSPEGPIRAALLIGRPTITQACGADMIWWPCDTHDVFYAIRPPRPVTPKPPKRHWPRP